MHALPRKLVPMLCVGTPTRDALRPMRRRPIPRVVPRVGHRSLDRLRTSSRSHPPGVLGMTIFFQVGKGSWRGVSCTGMRLFSFSGLLASATMSAVIMPPLRNTHYAIGQHYSDIVKRNRYEPPPSEENGRGLGASVFATGDPSIGKRGVTARQIRGEKNTLT